MTAIHHLYHIYIPCALATNVNNILNLNHLQIPRKDHTSVPLILVHAYVLYLQILLESMVVLRWSKNIKVPIKVFVFQICLNLLGFFYYLFLKISVAV